MRPEAGPEPARNRPGIGTESARNQPGTGSEPARNRPGLKGVSGSGAGPFSRGSAKAQRTHTSAVRGAGQRRRGEIRPRVAAGGGWGGGQVQDRELFDLKMQARERELGE